MNKRIGGLAACSALAAWLFAANLVQNLDELASDAREINYIAQDAYDKAERTDDRIDEVCWRLNC